MQQLADQVTSASTDFLPLNGTDYVEFYVGNARQAAYYYRAAFGMKLVAYRGPGDGDPRPGILSGSAGQDPFRIYHSSFTRQRDRGSREIAR